METLFLYIVKSSGLIALFYIAYYLLLRKETFFTANRWYLLAGLFTSLILPWIVFTTIVWVEPTPANFDWTRLPIRPAQKESFEINWYLVLAIAYIIGIALFLVQFALDFYNLNRVLKGKTPHKQADHKFIDLKENIAPFSYFNTIVYNSSLYSKAEMESILEHEKVHSEQYHTIDVLITRFFCILFWFNPFMWLYKKAILQNLEFIADCEASKNISDKKAYQLTLLKITAHENGVVLTNHFYQSLIKKRIVMLNKNQSKKSNSWKYVLILPALIAFVFLFQMEVIAKEKNVNPKAAQAASEDVDVYKITKNTTEAELKEKAATISKNYGVSVLFSNTKRNADNELTAITVELKKGNEISNNRNVNSSEAIKPFGIVITKDSNGKLNINFIEEDDKSIDKVVSTSKIVAPNAPIPADTQIYINEKKSEKTAMDELDPNEIATVNVIKNDEKKEIRIITKDYHKIGDMDEIYINGKKVSQNELDQLDQGSIDRIDVTNNFGKKGMRITTKNGTYYQEKNMPVPPAPPTPPVMKFKHPVPPVMPKAPRAPKGDPIHGDKKAWKEFEKQMDEFDAKMKKIEPQMEAFDKQMAEFDKQMEPFNKEMEVFNEKMKVFDKQMEEYTSKIEKEKK
ncbi:M56 family metallopeptidase [Flavobacterium sp. HJJ]|uniref:M56 family metallopeptidase n=1 Tax=Flavobacterium sp. HJJ TaxID=2783792 RepID=UPI00188C5A80|nr:M56 family metallopeptidase [Flavobacterium sp. HJJ]MBF4472573.1 peptidase M56 [Flavobacterium sp. HJJ]